MKHFLSLATVCLLLSGCGGKTELSGSDYAQPEINVTENKISHFFATDSDFRISSADKARLDKLLRDSKGEGIENIGFMIVSNSPVLKAQKAAITNQVKSQMLRAGFMESRIVNSGVCIYKDAKKGVRVDVLKYDLKTTDTDLWSDSIGDCDTQKQLPGWGKSMNYNMEEMIANSADFVAPRRYKGQRTVDAIAAATSGGASSGGGASSSSSGTN